MFHLARGLYNNWNKKEGLDNAVKSIYNPDAKIIPPERITTTVGQNVGHIQVNKTLLKFWDVGGQESLRSLWEEYFTHCHAIIFIVDSTDRERIEECQSNLTKIINNDSIESIPILMLANKQDVEDHLEVEDIKEIFNVIAEHLSARDSRVLPISAIKGDGLKECIDWLVIRLIRNKQNRPPRFK
ncbi:ADP-ribosylation factor 1 [Wickerhamomyces ciferrii]|uniref:ADP-ribosylation factor 1 n=1 Tax=Wickerhamomyces ciferrii (strain ATCC 14091 / BCRC 22168 / CBS 111 / JCM 3599 / NBRC 0793 / NRRL Y-1031 F-60-10) TaxID=1206466 RepID=K0KN34_WICCF|nr:ADP-ribosylation factor 1 [Wickerhamomyces ciferrii]CCH44386.1 ADP-ribosylation factor 1 [Wickerhamomyces ciferrii]